MQPCSLPPPPQDFWRPQGFRDPLEDVLPAVNQRVEVYWPGDTTWRAHTRAHTREGITAARSRGARERDSLEL